MERTTPENRPLLGLSLIVCDEAKSIAATVESARGAVDGIFVLDTGSTDGTPGIIRRAGDGLPVEIESGPFGDYASARNHALDMAARGGARYALSLSADEMLQEGDHLRAFLQNYDGKEDAFLVDVKTPTNVFPYPRVLRTRSVWRYVGEIHEEPRDERDPLREPKVKIPGCRVVYEPTDPERLLKRLKELDAPILSRRIRNEFDPLRKGRDAILLAQVHEQIADAAKGDRIAWSEEEFRALGLYALVMDSPIEEIRAHARMKFLNVAEQLGIYNSKEMLSRLRPLMVECARDPRVAYMLAAHTAKVDAKAGYQAARRAAEIALASVENPSDPQDPYGLLWRTHLLAAMCAKAVGDEEATREHVLRGKERAPQGAFEGLA